jgi:hypothetical protein
LALATKREGLVLVSERDDPQYYVSLYREAENKLVICSFEKSQPKPSAGRLESSFSDSSGGQWVTFLSGRRFTFEFQNYSYSGAQKMVFPTGRVIVVDRKHLDFLDSVICFGGDSETGRCYSIKYNFERAQGSITQKVSDGRAKVP